MTTTSRCKATTEHEGILIQCEREKDHHGKHEGRIDRTETHKWKQDS